MTLLLAFLSIVGALVGACAVIASRCPVVRIIAKLFSAQAERHQQARFHI